MWHEARKQEKKIRCMLVDYQRRAQRRKDYYDRIKADPTQFLQLHGRPCKIHLDPAVCIAANSSATMMPWQGNASVMIDRFDVRAHLDYIPEVHQNKTSEGDLSYEERQINYERYRILVQNEFFGITEDKFLHQIHLEEKFGPVLKNAEESHSNKKKATAAIGYNYDEDDSGLNTSSSLIVKSDDSIKNNSIPLPLVNVDGDDENDSESDIDLDLTVDVSKIDTQQANELNACAHPYGMMTNDFFSFLNNDLEEAENMRIVKEQEEEKAMFSGRKSRKERRAFRERTLVGRKLSPPSYAWRKSPSYEDYKALVSSNRSRSKSSSPQNSGKITYITSFGGDEPSSSSTAPKSSMSSSTLSKEAIRRRLTSRSRSKEKERTKRLRRSRSASADYRRRSLARSRLSHSRTRSRSRSRIKSKRSRSRSEHRKVSPRSSPKTVTNVTSSGTGFGNNSDQNSIPRYYGRNRDQSSSELSLSSDGESSKQSESFKSKTSQVAGPSRSNASNKNAAASEKLTPQERLRRKRQVLLNKQFKADKRAEREKVLKQVQERIDRAEEMKEISIKLRRRQRMLRHNDSPRRYSSRSRSSSSGGRSASRSPYSRRARRCGERHRGKSASDDDSTDSGSRSDKRRDYRKCRDSISHSRSRSRSRSRTRSRARSRSRSRTPRRGKHSEERDSRRQSIREYDKGSRSKRYCSLSEERELARSQLESKTDSAWRDDYKARRERSPKSKLNNHAGENSDERRERAHESDRYGTSRGRYSGRRSSSRDRYSSRYDY